MRSRASRFKWEDSRAFLSAGSHCLYPAPSQSVEVSEKEEMVSEHISQTPLQEFWFLDSSYSRHKGFSQLSWAASRATPRSADGKAFGLEDPAYLEEQPRENVACEAFECACYIPTSRSSLSCKPNSKIEMKWLAKIKWLVGSCSCCLALWLALPMKCEYAEAFCIQCVVHPLNFPHVPETSNGPYRGCSTSPGPKIKMTWTHGQNQPIMDM